MIFVLNIRYKNDFSSYYARGVESTGSIGHESGPIF